jgi:general stress protein YciG
MTELSIPGEPKDTSNEDEATMDAIPPSKRGFAAMDREAVRAIAKKGGAAAHARGTAHRFTAEEARTAGRKGGAAPHKTRGGRRSTKSKVAPSSESGGANT